MYSRFIVLSISDVAMIPYFVVVGFYNSSAKFVSGIEGKF